MKPAVIAAIVGLVCCLISSSASGYFVMNASPAPEPETVTETVPVKVRGCTDSTATNYNASAEEDDGTCIATVMGCTSPEAFNFSSEANTDDGSCVDYVSGNFTRTGGDTENPAEITQDLRLLIQGDYPHSCQGKSGQELLDCASEQMQVCKDVCDTNSWCKGVRTSLNSYVKKHGHELYCDFATTDEPVTRNENPGPDSDIGYLKA